MTKDRRIIEEKFRRQPDATPDAFYEKLKEKIESKGVDFLKLPRLSSPENPPECFVTMYRGDRDAAAKSYREWLSSASMTEMRYRFDMPGEPNYCHDCTFAMKEASVRAGTCKFPGTIFELSRAFGEKELTGVSRSAMVPPDGLYQFEGMILPRDAMPQDSQDFLNYLEKLKNEGKE